MSDAELRNYIRKHGRGEILSALFEGLTPREIAEALRPVLFAGEAGVDYRLPPRSSEPELSQRARDFLIYYEVLCQASDLCFDAGHTGLNLSPVNDLGLSVAANAYEDP